MVVVVGVVVGVVVTVGVRGQDVVLIGGTIVVSGTGVCLLAMHTASRRGMLQTLLKNFPRSGLYETHCPKTLPVFANLLRTPLARKNLVFLIRLNPVQ